MRKAVCVCVCVCVRMYRGVFGDTHTLSSQVSGEFKKQWGYPQIQKIAG